MKTKSKQSKAIVAMAGVIMLLVALSISLTFAFFTARTSSETENVVFGTLKTSTSDFGYTKIDTGVLTDGASGKQVSNTIRLSNVVPGQTLTLEGQMDVVANIDIFVRMRTNIDVTLGTDSAAALTALATAYFNEEGTGEPKTLVLDSAANVALNTQVTVPNVAAGTYTDAAAFAGAVKAAQEVAYERTIRGYLFNSAETDDIRIAGGTSKWLNAAGSSFSAGGAVGEWYFYQDKINYELEATGVAASSGTGYTFTAIDLDNATIALETSLDNYWQGATVEISFDLEAIQAEHAGTAGAAIVLTGTPAEKAAAIAGAVAWTNSNTENVFGN